MVEMLRNCLSPAPNSRLVDRFGKWNNNNCSCVILNVDGSCLSSPIQSEFSRIIRNTSDYYLSEFSGFIQWSYDILFAELYAIYKDLLLAKEIDKLACYSDSLHCNNLIKGSKVLCCVDPRHKAALSK
jgi:hypothetical protein